MEEIKLVVEIWPLSIAPSRNEAKSSPVSALIRAVHAACIVALDGNASRTGEVHFAVWKRHLKEGELMGFTSAPNFNAWRSLGDSHVLDKVPDVAVFLRRQPVVGANLAIVSQAELRKAAIQSGGGIADRRCHGLKFVGLGIGLNARRHQAAESNARFRNERRTTRYG